MAKEKVVFESEAHAVEIDAQKMTGVWTDGVMLSSDNGMSKMMSGVGPCAMHIKAGAKYRVTVEEI